MAYIIYDNIKDEYVVDAGFIIYASKYSYLNASREYEPITNDEKFEIKLSAFLQRAKEFDTEKEADEYIDAILKYKIGSSDYMILDKDELPELMN